MADSPKRLFRNVRTHLNGVESYTEPEPRWPILVTFAAVALLHFGLPASMTPFGATWVLPAIVAALAVPAAIAHRTRRYALNRDLGLALSLVVTLFVVYSLYQLVELLIAPGKTDALLVLRAAAMLWLTNVLVFANWYWRLDAGGPHAREARDGHNDGDFLFPQMSLDREVRERICIDPKWMPGFVDYLFLAFNASTALSPADTPVLSRWAKLMMMVQALISLSIIGLVAARAVNVLQG